MKVIYPGTFDPPTLGHLDIAKRASKMFDHLIIAVGTNPQKEPTFSVKERMHLWESCVKGIPNIEITSFSGLLVDFAEKRGCKTVLRAIRNVLDFEYETLQSQMNRALSNIETIYLVVDEKYHFISSTLVKEVAAHKKNLEAFLPKEISGLVQKHFL